MAEDELFERLRELVEKFRSVREEEHRKLASWFIEWSAHERRRSRESL